MPLAPSGIRQVYPQPSQQDPAEVSLHGEGDLDVNKSGNIVTIEFPDGSVNINLNPLGGAGNPEDAKKHDENLALHLDSTVLESVSDNLLRLIEDDIRRQDQRLRDVIKGIDLLGIKLEEPRPEPNEEGISVVKHPLLLEAILRFQANSRGELLPADGPVKVDNDGTQTIEQDEIANTLEKDFNHYLTTGAPEYYPDTDRMFFSLGHGGEAYKKVYKHPIKRRPVSETIDRKDLILSEGAVSIEACGRVTHRSRMKPSDVKRMQLSKVWRDIQLSQQSLSDTNPVDLKLANVAGVAPKTSIEPDQLDREIYECYCEIDLQGFEHTEDGDRTGLALPYRVTMDKESRQCLELRRWWKEDDPAYIREEVFVEYVFVPAFPGVNLGLLHILGNATRALTAAWRIALDNGMLANFPGGLMSRQAGKQQTTNIRVGPGGLAPVDTEGGTIKDSFMPLPYRDVTPGFVQVVQAIEATAQRVGGTSETSVGEGRQDAPVGTTIAMIEQATKMLNAVHKRMHQAQSKEFGLLKKLFKDDPQCLWISNVNPGFQKNVQQLSMALANKNIVPKADPNCSSQTLRIQKAIAIKTLASANPQLYDMAAVDRRIMEMVGIEDIDSLFSQVPPQQPQPDPSKMIGAQAQMLGAQAKMADQQVQQQELQLKNKDNQADQSVKLLQAHTAARDSQTESENRAADRASKEKLEMMHLAQTEAVHPETGGLIKKLMSSTSHSNPVDLGGLPHVPRAYGGRVVDRDEALDKMANAIDKLADSVGGEKEVVRDSTGKIVGARRKPKVTWND